MIDVIIVAIIVGVVALSVYTLIKNKKQGKTCCGCDCSHCSGCKNANQTDQQKR